jgi:hypothetical protein
MGSSASAVVTPEYRLDSGRFERRSREIGIDLIVECPKDDKAIVSLSDTGWFEVRKPEDQHSATLGAVRGPASVFDVAFNTKHFYCAAI